MAIFRASARCSAHGFDVVAEAADAPNLARKVAGHRPDVVITDARMPPGGVTPPAT